MQGGVWLWPEVVSMGIYAEGAVVIPVGNSLNPSREWLYGQLQVSVSEPKSLPGWSFELGAGGIPVARDTSKGIDFTVGVSYRHRKKKES